MAFCPNCGKELAAEARFCPNCGATNAAAPMTGPAPAPMAGPAPVMNNYGTQTGLQPNTAGLLCYVLGWLTGLIFYFVEKNPFVRFHAVQSVIVFLPLQIAQYLLFRLIFAISWRLWAVASLLNTLLWVGELGLALFLMFKAYNNEKYKLPFVGDLAEKYSA
ncbi:MAG TPA: zinc-ribbon domain-containing protein [Symbiobacteriaceae bacterium]|nr:zinc-ribbon domain-containing protein [Symbiobacteriaceae bacterium]